MAGLGSDKRPPERASEGSVSDMARKTAEVRKVRYAYVESGFRDRPAVLLLHGFTGSCEDFAPLMRALSEEFHCIAVDLLGHGRSGAPDDPRRYAMQEVAADLSELLAASTKDGRAACLGYSLGGRVALGFAATCPEAVWALALESASPGLRDPSARRERAAADGKLADEIQAGGVTQFVRRWESHPLFATQAGLPEEVLARQRRTRLSQRAEGLAGSLRGIGAGAQPSFWDKLPELRMPSLLISGERDTRYTSIAQEMAGLIPGARRLTLLAGHNAHLEQPDEYASAVRVFFQECARPFD